ncbi:MAG: hypothetical protein ACK4ST_01375, partial [Elioraea tepidiphila]
RHMNVPAAPFLRGGGRGGDGDGGAVSLDNRAAVGTAGDSAFGLVAQSIRAGGGIGAEEAVEKGFRIHARQVVTRRARFKAGYLPPSTLITWPLM